MDPVLSQPLRKAPGIDLDGALARLAALPLSLPAEAERQLGELLDSLAAHPPAPRVLFQILENAGDALYFVRETAAQRFQQNAPHLKPAEEALFLGGVETWRKVADAYALCTSLRDSVGAGDHLDPGVAEYEATLLHRRLYYTGALILDHYRARREIPAETWRHFHGCYRRAEDLGIAETPVNDLAQEEGGTTDCRSVWAAYLLLEIAHPYGRDSRELALLLRWVFHGASLVGVHPVAPGRKVPQFLVLLGEDAPLQPGTDSLAAREDARQLSTALLTAKLSLAQDELRKGELPAWLGIGENAVPTARRLLRQVHSIWALKTGQRRFRRAPSRDSAMVCTGFNAMHYFIRLHNRLSAPGPGAEGQPAIPYRTEPWEVVDQSPAGFRLARSNPATPPANGQLIAFLPHDGEQFLLGQVTWIKLERSGRLILGVAVLPGIPQAFSVQVDSRIKGQPPIQACAFLLPALPAMEAPATAVLPVGLGRPGARLATDHGGCRHLVPEEIIQAGPDFERVSFRTG